jgi:polyhydroxyalkanoate synthase subunit PhaE
MANQDSNNFVESVISAQKKAIETLAENTKKIANGNTFVSETIDKGSEWYNNLLDTQKATVDKTTEKTADMNKNMQDNVSKMNEFYQNWFNNQSNMAKQMWENTSNLFQNAANSNGASNNNPMNTWTNWMNNFNTMNNNMNQANNWMNMMNQWKNMFNMDGMKQNGGDWTAMFNQYTETLNNSFSKWQETMQNGTSQCRMAQARMHTRICSMQLKVLHVSRNCGLQCGSPSRKKHSTWMFTSNT